MLIYCTVLIIKYLCFWLLFGLQGLTPLAKQLRHSNHKNLKL